MLIPDGGYWENVGNIGAKSYACGYPHCGRHVSSERGWRYVYNGHALAVVLICPSCRRPTVVDLQLGEQIPPPPLGSDVQSLPTEVHALWSEIRSCTAVGAYTAAVLAGRKLLMHIAVSQGAEPGKSFLFYVDYLVDNHYAPPKSKVWVDKIRAHGNEATHEITLKTKSDAQEIIVFSEMLLKFNFEFPNAV